MSAIKSFRIRREQNKNVYVINNLENELLRKYDDEKASVAYLDLGVQYLNIR